MLRKIYLSITAGLIMTASLTSCLDKVPSSTIPLEEGMNTFKDAELIMYGVHSIFKSSSLYSGKLTLLPDIQADLVYAVDGFSNTYGAIWQWDILPSNQDIRDVYQALYMVVGRCNYYMDNVEKVRNTIKDPEQLTLLDEYTGRVHCARALAYSELIKCFCKAYDPDTAADELGVALKISYLNKTLIERFNEDFDPKTADYETFANSFVKIDKAKRASLKDSYKFVLYDLYRAAELMDEDNDRFNNEFFSLSAVYALHARVALYMQDWNAAIEYAGKVIDRENNPFSLSNANFMATSALNYYEYMWDYDYSYEAIWRIGFTPTSYGGALGQLFLGYTNDYHYYYPDFVPAAWIVKTPRLYRSGDKRYAALFADLQTGYSHRLSWPLLIKYYGNRNFVNNNLIYHVNMPKVFRLSELYLIRAEAYCSKPSPDFNKASNDLRVLRGARFSSGSAGLSAINWQQEISDERVRELYMEGFRLHDLKRWALSWEDFYTNDVVFKRKPQSNSLTNGSSLEVKVDNPLFVWPIPQHELDAPGSEMQPNDSNFRTGNN